MVSKEISRLLQQTAYGIRSSMLMWQPSGVVPKILLIFGAPVLFHLRSGSKFRFAPRFPWRETLVTRHSARAKSCDFVANLIL